jgi:hypothetical protein
MSNTSTEGMNKITWWRKQIQRFYRILCCVPSAVNDEENAPSDVSMAPNVIIESCSDSEDHYIYSEPESEDLSTGSDSEELPTGVASPEDLRRKPRVRIIQPLVIRDDKGIKED